MARSKANTLKFALITLACIVLAVAAFVGVFWGLVYTVASGEIHLEEFAGKLDESPTMARAKVEGWFGDGWFGRGRSEGWTSEEVEPSAIPTGYDSWQDWVTQDDPTVVRYRRLGVEAYMIYDDRGNLELFIDAN